MPSRIFKIEWDEPDDINWLNRFSLELVLADYCPNTGFEVSDWPEIDPVVPDESVYERQSIQD